MGSDLKRPMRLSLAKKISIGLLGGLLCLPGMAQAADVDPTVQALVNEVKELRMRLNQMESRLEEAKQKAEAATTQADKARMEARKSTTNSLKASSLWSKAQAQKAEGVLTEAGKRLSIAGAVELEGYYEKMDPKNGEESKSSGLDLATAEVFFTANINDYTTGVVHMLWEEGDDGVGLDEGFIVLGDTKDMPFYLMGGRIYPAIGLFESYFISDPLTLEAFETQATAAEVGWNGEWLSIGAGLYNSDVAELDDAPDDNINTFYARAQVETPEEMLNGAVVKAGVAYTNNIAGSDFLREQVPGAGLDDLVGGWSVMAGVEYGMFAFTGEYVAALDDFKAGELAFAGGDKASPSAYNLELAFMPVEKWTFAARYEGTSDLYEELPEHQYGLAASWEFLPDTAWSVEYLRGEFENDDTRDLVTTQLAVAF
jgi:hypothetical protein